MLGIDFGDISGLAAELASAGARVKGPAEAVVHRGANNIVREARDLAPKGPVIRNYPRTITYDVTTSPGVIEAEIGPDADVNEQAKLGTILEHGTVNQPPHPHLDPALEHELPRFEDALGEVGARAMLI